ncbi:hypothetical protein E4U54_005467 [Claviceps lovelessii]|nr:hypothetical protein E4U54_005467 [Claviceps lovelessii]
MSRPIGSAKHQLPRRRVVGGLEPRWNLAGDSLEPRWNLAGTSKLGSVPAVPTEAVHSVGTIGSPAPRLKWSAHWCRIQHSSMLLNTRFNVGCLMDGVFGKSELEQIHPGHSFHTADQRV